MGASNMYNVKKSIKLGIAPIG
ncbi:TPA: hypothetical protein ACIO4A_004437, partial [Salmonella enterica subsp. enterica serovar Virchow]